MATIGQEIPESEPTADFSLSNRDLGMMTGIGIAHYGFKGVIGSMRQGLRRGEGGVYEIQESA